MKRSDEKGPGPAQPGDWMDRMQGDSETQKILRLWKGRRFLRRLRQWVRDRDRNASVEGNGRTSWPRN